jgi:leucyl aminopeptidase
MPPQIVVSNQATTDVSCDVLVVPARCRRDGISLSTAARRVDEALDGYLSEYLGAVGFGAGVAEIEIVPTGRRLPCTAVAVVGLGSSDGADPDPLRRAAAGVARKLAERSVLASALHDGGGDAATMAAAEGFLLGAYRYKTHTSQPKPAKLERILFLGDSNERAIERATTVAEATALARDLTNEPSSLLPPEALARRAREVAEVTGLACTIFDENQLEERGFGGILGVGRGSAQAPRLIQLHYQTSEAQRKIVLVGKGITFDSGGLSIKDAKSMETMKTDMAGAAAVIATMSALGRIGADVEVIGLVPACENMPGGRALKPGDVITHYGGRTTEVNNTDAEGRLVLADALAYASESHPDAMVDVATLTGGVMVALGRRSTGLFANDDALADEIESAARSAGERMWRLPLYGDYKSELESEVADLKNSGGRFGAAIIAAVFLEQFVAPGIPWGHLDIAGTARSESDSGEVGKGGTGVAVRTLLAWAEGRRS